MNFVNILGRVINVEKIIDYNFYHNFETEETKMIIHTDNKDVVFWKKGFEACQDMLKALKKLDNACGLVNEEYICSSPKCEVNKNTIMHHDEVYVKEIYNDGHNWYYDVVFINGGSGVYHEKYMRDDTSNL